MTLIINHFCYISRIREYQDIFSGLSNLVANASTVLVPSTLAYSGGASFAIYQTVGESGAVWATIVKIWLELKFLLI